MSDRPSLALDIGTRKVVGLLTQTGPKGLKIIAAERLEHSTRAMYDGQIHDVGEVAAVVGKIVQKLSAKAGVPLTEAAVAAAGRALRTHRGTAGREFSGLAELTGHEVFALELEAVQAAQAALASALKEREKPQDFHYVGHSAMGARLDGLPIGNLVGQRGNRAEIDVIATFLPRGVVDSLQAVLQRCNLEMTALTLEPIAALAVAVPQTMRHLNLVLVDIGAGTSDIAITSKGSVLAYDMVPIAGDEITEALSEAYLLDFRVGETAKRQVTLKDQVAFTDILGGRHTVTRTEVSERLRPAVERLAREVSDRVLRLNGGPPQAVMLVGGGSLTPGLAGAVAEALGLPGNRVAVRGRDAVEGVEGAKSQLSGPDCITPIGIAVASRDKSTLGFSYVHVNDRGVRLFHPATLTVADALLAAGISIRDLQGQVGKGFTVTLNGSLRIVRGTFGRPARISKNGEPALLETAVAHRDRISVNPGTAGEPGKASVAEIASESLDHLRVTVNGVEHALSPIITVNGELASADRPLADNDSVVVRPLRTVEDVMLHLGLEDPSAVDVVRYSVDGTTRVSRRPRFQIGLNGARATPETPVRDGDSLDIAPSSSLAIREVAAASLAGAGAVRVRANGQVVEFETGRGEVHRNGYRAGLDDPVNENDVITVTPGGEPPLYAHLLARIGLSTTPPPGRTRLVTLLNGQPADFTSPLQDGDVAEIYWE